MVNKILEYAVFVSLILLGIAMSQPVWRGEAMAIEFKDDCQKRGGVLLEHKNLMGITYKCVSRLD